MKRSDWSKTSWHNFQAEQQPKWPDINFYNEILEKITELPALVFAGETRILKRRLAEASSGKLFVLQCGDCSEEFSGCNGPRIHSLLKVILQMSLILAYSGGKRIVNIGRIAGQYAKPRSSDIEVINGEELPSYRGDMVNSAEPYPEVRVPDPSRILDGYFRSAATLNLLRAFTSGGYASLGMANTWHHDFSEAFPSNPKYENLIEEIQRAITFSNSLGTYGVSFEESQMILFSSHEALLLGYEEVMTRIDTVTGDWFDTSAHMLWIGDRTRQLDGAHVEFLRGVGNPVGVKIGPDHTIDNIKKVVRKLNPENHAGKIVLITRFGLKKISKYLPPLLRAFRSEGFNVVWLCDPMHGNTYFNKKSIKTRDFGDILEETRLFFQIHEAEKTVAGGVHLELTGDMVTECTGGHSNLFDEDLAKNYQTTCDPRLNAPQAVEFAFELAEILNKR